jgi:hypothetical protein
MEHVMSCFKTLCVVAFLSAGLSGCFDTSNKDQGTMQNPDNGSSVQMKQH